MGPVRVYPGSGITGSLNSRKLGFPWVHILSSSSAFAHHNLRALPSPPQVQSLLHFYYSFMLCREERNDLTCPAVHKLAYAPSSQLASDTSQ